MRQDTVRLSVTIPARILTDLEAEVRERGKCSFIAQAIEEKLRGVRQARLEAELIEGYRAGRAQGQELAREFASADLEGWEDAY